MKPIAVISSNKIATLHWLIEEKKIKTINNSQKLLIDENDNHYVIISSPDEVLSWEFSSAITAPDYYSLETVVRSRIR